MTLASPDFDTLTITEVDKATARAMIVANHYSHKWQTVFGEVNVGVYCGSRLLGVAVFGYPMNPSSWASITTLNPDGCIELNRLWIDDDLGANTETWLLGKSFSILRSRGYRLVQSFADGRLGVGTIYQAANFTYHGAHVSRFHGDTVTGEVTHSAPFNNTAKARSMVACNLLFARGHIETFSTHTYRYLYPLDRGARRAILLPAKPYPKERHGITKHPDYTPPVAQIARATALAHALGNTDAGDELHTYLSTLTTDPDTAIAEQSGNRWVMATTSRMSRRGQPG